MSLGSLFSQGSQGSQGSRAIGNPSISSAREPFIIQHTAIFHQPNHRYRTLPCMNHLHTSPAISSLQNLMMYESFPCSSSHTIATEPLNTHIISVLLQPCHHYRTLQYTHHLHVPPTTSTLQTPRAQLLTPSYQSLVTSHPSPAIIFSKSPTPFFPK